MNTNWHIRACCLCGWSKEVPFGDLFHLHVECCPRCGTEKSQLSIRKQRFISLSKWWNPITWGDWDLQDFASYREPNERLS